MITWTQLIVFFFNIWIILYRKREAVHDRRTDCIHQDGYSGRNVTRISSRCDFTTNLYSAYLFPPEPWAVLRGDRNEQCNVFIGSYSEINYSKGNLTNLWINFHSVPMKWVSNVVYLTLLSWSFGSQVLYCMKPIGYFRVIHSEYIYEKLNE